MSNEDRDILSSPGSWLRGHAQSLGVPELHAPTWPPLSCMWLWNTSSLASAGCDVWREIHTRFEDSIWKKECKISQYFSYHLYEELITFWIYWVKEDTWLKQMLCISLLIWLLGNLKAHTWLALVSHTLFLWHYSRGHFLLKLLTVSGPSQAVTSPMISKSEVVYYKLPGAETWHWSAQCVPSIWQPVGLAK